MIHDIERDELNSIREAIDDAEELADPLEGLVEKSADDPGAAFTPEVLEGLASLRKTDRAAFEGLRAQLKGVKCRVTELDAAIAEKQGATDGRTSSQAEILVQLAEAAELFHAPDGVAYADLDVDGHRETWAVRSTGFRRWLTREYYQQTSGAPNSEALQSALNLIEAKAQFDGPVLPVHIRVGGLEGRIYLDIGDDAWRAVEVEKTGWRVIERPPIRFRRANGMQPLPVPVSGGSVNALRSFLNVQSDNDFVLVVSWALAVLRDRGPYPVLVLSGEQGSAKSTFSAILRSLLDPNTAPLRALPREERDLFIAANNGHLLVFDNVSGLPAWTSDTLCRLATGGAFAARRLYTDQDEVLFDAARPAILNEIEDIVARPDLADRAIFLRLAPIAEEQRKPEAILKTAFEAERPRMLGALLDAVAKGLATLPRIRLEKSPRMADFALWATACEAALWRPGTFQSAYAHNREEAVDDVIDADLVATAVRTLMTTRTEWVGNASELLNDLGLTGERTAKDPRTLAGRLRRAATCLRQIGIKIDFKREGHFRKRVIRISTTPSQIAPPTGGAPSSARSASSALSSALNPVNGFEPPTARTVIDPADDAADGTASTVRADRLKCNGADHADDADAKAPPPIGAENAGYGTPV